MQVRETVDVSETDLWKEADSNWFSNSYLAIVKKESVSAMAKTFFVVEKTEEETLTWLNDYLQFYRDNSYGDLIKEQAVFPNQQKNFKKLSELCYDCSIPEVFKDLDNLAKSPNKPLDDCRLRLLHRSILGYEQHSPLSIKDIYEYVKKEFNESNDSTKEAIARYTISILVKQDSGEPEERKLYDFAKTISGYKFEEAKYIESSVGFNWGFAQEHYIKLLAERIANSVNLDGFKELSQTFMGEDKAMNTKELIHWIDKFIVFLHDYKSKKYWSIITDKDHGIGIWLNQNNNFCRFHDVCKDASIPEELKDLCAKNRYLNRDFREEVFSLDSSITSYLETTPITLTEVGKYVDEKIKDYDGNKQDKDFRALIFTIRELCNSIERLEDIMPYFKEKKSSLIVGSLGEGPTMDLVSSIVQQEDSKIHVVKEILERNSIDDLNKAKALLRFLDENQSYSIEEIIKEIPHLLEKNVEINSSEDEISKRKMYEAQLEAQRKLMEIRHDWTFPKGYGECNNEGKPYCYSTICITDEAGENHNIVLKSYKDCTATFKINPKEWEAVVRDDAKLLVYTRVNGMLDIVEIPQGDLIMNQSKISITFSSVNLKEEEFTDRVSTFAETLHYFKELHFDFDKFHIATNATSVRDIYAKQQGSQVQTSDDDL